MSLRANFFQYFLSCAGNLTRKFPWVDSVYFKPTVSHNKQTASLNIVHRRILLAET